VTTHGAVTDDELIQRARDEIYKIVGVTEPQVEALFRAVDERDELRKRVKQLEHGYDVLRTAVRRKEGRVAELERGEYICQKCGLRKDGEAERGEF
jgi:predicted  nucleic acid-binding Zn-ribbon protein